ncbi:MAG: hypothetical protein Q4G59_00390 [Planctomycetia bacterium]|nr:hypothetical protein [Planctomycetia bacterium]
MVKTYYGGATMYNKHVISVFLILFVSVLSCGCCLTGKKKETAAEPFRGAAPTTAQPPIVTEPVPQPPCKTNTEEVPPGGVTGTTSSYGGSTSTGEGSACPTGTCPGAPPAQVITVTPTTTNKPESVIQLPAPRTDQSGSPLSGGTSTQVDKPVSTPESKPASPPATQPSAPGMPTPAPGHGPVTTGSFDYASKEGPSQSGSDDYRPVSEEEGVGVAASQSATSLGTTEKPSSGNAPASKPKGKTVSLEKEVPASDPAATPAKKDSSTNTDDPTDQDNLDASSESGMEYNSEYSDGGDLTKARPAKSYVEESTQPKYARGYTGPPATSGMQQTIPFVSPGIYGEARTSIRIQAVP